MKKIELNGKKMNLLEARLLLLGLNLGLSKTRLDETETETYTRWKKLRENKNFYLARKRESQFKTSKRAYLIERTDKEISKYLKYKKEDKNKEDASNDFYPFVSKRD